MSLNLWPYGESLSFKVLLFQISLLFGIVLAWSLKTQFGGMTNFPFLSGIWHAMTLCPVVTRYIQPLAQALMLNRMRRLNCPSVGSSLTGFVVDHVGPSSIPQLLLGQSWLSTSVRLVNQRSYSSPSLSPASGTGLFSIFSVGTIQTDESC